MASKQPAGKAAARPGPLRIAVPVGPAPSPVWCVRNSSGEIEGIAVDLARHLAQGLGLDTELIPYASSGAIVADVGSGNWDLAFVPADEERKRHVTFGPNFYIGDSTYLVGEDTGATDLVSIDAEGRTIAGIEGTATLRSARRTLKHATAIGLMTMDEAIARFEDGSVDAIALGRELLVVLQKTLKRRGIVLADSFHSAGSALAVPPGRDATQLGALLEAAKADGTLRTIFDRHGFADLPIAPVASYP